MPRAGPRCHPEHLPGASRPAATPAQPPGPPPRPRAPRAATAAAAPPPGARVATAYPQRHPGAQGGGGLLGRALQLPLFVLRTALGVVTSVAHLGMALATLAGDAVLPRSIMQRARGERPGWPCAVSDGDRALRFPLVEQRARRPPTPSHAAERPRPRVSFAAASTAIASSVAAARGPPPDPAVQAAEFIAAYRAAHGERGPAFLQQGWAQATSTAHSQFKFLFVYLHSPEHEVGACGRGRWRGGRHAGPWEPVVECGRGAPAARPPDGTRHICFNPRRSAQAHSSLLRLRGCQDTGNFCRNVLGSPEVLSYVQEQFVAWGGDIRRADAFTVRGRGP
jgi:hypothetical protein